MSHVNRRSLDQDSRATVAGSDQGGWYVYAGAGSLGPFGTRSDAQWASYTHNAIRDGRAYDRRTN